MISLVEGVPLNNDEHKTKAGPTVWVAQEGHGSVQTLTFRYQFLSIASSHYPQHQFTVLSVDGIYKICFLLRFTVCKSIPYYVSKGHMPAFSVPCWVGLLVSRFHLFLTWNHCDWLPIPLTLAFAPESTHCWTTPCPFHHHQFPNEELFAGFDISVPVPATSKYIFINEVPCLAVKAQSSKTSIPIVTHASTPFPCRGLWNGCQENTIMCWHKKKYNSLT